MSECEISPSEANYWWRRNSPAGATLNNLMFLFIVVPVGLVIEKLYLLSFLVFAFMVPYGLFVRHLSVRAVKQHLLEHPETRDEFERNGIISC